MISLHSILTAAETVTQTDSADALIQTILTVIAVVAGALAVIAFINGFLKGFRKVSWDGIAWLAGGLLFIGISSMFPMNGSVRGNFWVAIILALICAGVTFAVFQVLALFLRPRMRWVKDNVNADTSLAEYGLEFEPEYVDYDGEHDYAPYGKRIYKTGYGEPTFFNRFMGGVSGVITVGMFVWAALSVFLLFISVAFNDAPIIRMLDNETIALLFPFMKNYFFDFICIGIMLIMAKTGYRRGLIYSIRTVVMTAGVIGSLWLCFYLPFSPIGAEGGALGRIVGICTDLFIDFNATLAPIFGKLIVALLILLACSVALVILNIVMRKLTDLIVFTGFTNELDSWLAAAVYLVVGMAICVGMWFLLASVDAMGIFGFGAMLGEASTVSMAMYEYAMSIVGPFFAQL